MKTILKILKILLIPLSIFYGLIIEIRNLLYDFKILSIKHYSLPVISVGNLTVGGTGKTPVIIMLAGLLQKRGVTIAVVSRGYGRTSKGVQLVSDGKEIKVPVSVSGDEAQLIAHKLPRAIVAVGEKRSEAIDFVLQQFHPQVILLDDAFQHRAVHRDLDIVLWNCRQPFWWNLPLPSGTLREFQYRIRRGDAYFLTKFRKGEKLPSLPGNTPQFNISSPLMELVDFDFKPAGTLSDLSGEKLIAFAGLAHPQDFKKSLTDAGLNVVCFRPFADHAKYQSNDVHDLFEECRLNGVKTLVCTEKDLVKIRELEAVSDRKIRILAASLTMNAVDEKNFEVFMWGMVDSGK